MLLGYARVSTDDQDLRLQRGALKEVGCKRVYEEKVSGARRDRPQLARLLDQVREEDVVVVTRLDRLARSTRDLLDVAEQLQEAGAGLRSLGEPWADTTSPAGRMVLTVFAGIAEFERALIHQRTSSGRVAAMQRGVQFGRPKKLAADQIVLAQRLLGEGTPVRAIAKMLHVHAATLYRALSAEPLLVLLFLLTGTASGAPLGVAGPSPSTALLVSAINRPHILYSDDGLSQVSLNGIPEDAKFEQSAKALSAVIYNMITGCDTFAAHYLVDVALEAMSSALADNGYGQMIVTSQAEGVLLH